MENSNSQTQVSEMHLKPGELDALLKFLHELEMERKGSFRPTTAKTGDAVGDLLEEIFALGTKKILEYRNTSTYGRTEDEIVRNARAHICNCSSCMEQYKQKVQREAYRASSTAHKILDNGFPESEMPFEFRNFFKKMIVEYDTLRILCQN